MGGAPPHQSPHQRVKATLKEVERRVPRAEPKTVGSLGASKPHRNDPNFPRLLCSSILPFHRTTAASIKEHASVLSLAVPFVAKVRVWVVLDGSLDHWTARSSVSDPTDAHGHFHSRSTPSTSHVCSLQPHLLRTPRPSVFLRAWVPCCGYPVPVRWGLGRWVGWRGWGRLAWQRGRRRRFVGW
jgi:hypothetical protein